MLYHRGANSSAVLSQVLPKAGPEECADLLRRIASDFLNTEEGRAAYGETCEDFTWGDMETHIPYAFFSAYGVMRCDVISVLADQDELLGDGIWADDAL